MPTTFTTGYNGTGSGPFLYFTGSTPSSDLVPSVYPVALNGRPYILDDALLGEAWKHESIPLLREQQDARDEPGEQSVNPAGYWRRAQEDWALGTGQEHYDRPESLAERFAISKNVAPFEQEWELGLAPLPVLYDTFSYAESDLMVSAGTYLYATRGTALWRSSASGVGMSLFHDFGSTITALQSDGYWVYVAAGSDLFRFARDAGAPGAAWSSGIAYDELGTVKDRVIGSKLDEVYEVDGAGTATLIYTGPSPDWRVSDITEGEGFIFFSGGAGDRWSIYSIDILDDGTGLAPPQVAAELPEGEIATACEGYLAFLLIGVDRGVRLGIPNDAGDVTLGALIDVTGFEKGVESFEGQGSIVTFEWQDFDAGSAGLGQIDLSRFTDPDGLVPAYSEWTFVEGTNHFHAITRRENSLYAISPSSGIYEIDASNPTLQDEGNFESGWINWNLPAEEKQLAWIRLDTNGNGQYLIEMKQDDGAYQTVALVTEKRNRIPIEYRGIRFQYRITLKNTEVDPPLIYGVGLEAYIAADTTGYITVPLILAEDMMHEGYQWYRGVADELSRLKSLRENRTLTTYQEGSQKYTVILEDYQWTPHNMINTGPERGSWNGTFVAQLKVIERSLGTGVATPAAPGG